MTTATESLRHTCWGGDLQCKACELASSQDAIHATGPVRARLCIDACRGMPDPVTAIREVRAFMATMAHVAAEPRAVDYENLRLLAARISALLGE